ncbi:MAG: class I SAM-dependent methyltransferase [Thermodesulfobacteriota bacterium]|nr:class I SAM-dependent methyltransferase [Thermodesulfobacteriota bacterium]
MKLKELLLYLVVAFGRRMPRLLRFLPLRADMITRLNSKEAYDLLYAQDDMLDQYLSPGRLSFYEEVANHCSEVLVTTYPVSTVRVVDLGCGTGHLLFYLWKCLGRSPHVEFWGVDHAPAAIERGKELMPQAKLIIGDIYNTNLYSNYFDLVLCTETLEHLQFPERAVKEMDRICRPCGKTVITVPDGAKDKWAGHVNFWTESDLWEFLKPFGVREILPLDNEMVFGAVLSKDREVI